MTAINPHPELVDGVDVDALSAAVRACAGVDDLDAGACSAFVSYLPGRRLAGVSVYEDHVTIGIRSRWGLTLPDLGRDVQAAVKPMVGRRWVDVVVCDIADPPEDETRFVPPGPIQRQIAEAASWTSVSTAPTAVPSSAPATPTAVVTLPSSQRALPPSASLSLALGSTSPRPDAGPPA